MRRPGHGPAAPFWHRRRPCRWSRSSRAAEALGRSREASNGRLDSKPFPANQLGSDTDLLSQACNGGVEFFNLATSILNTLVPAVGRLSIGFAETDAVLKAIDGPFGEHLADQFAKVGLVPVTPLWSNGFRQITSSTRDIVAPSDLAGFKIRVPPAWRRWHPSCSPS